MNIIKFSKRNSIFIFFIFYIIAFFLFRDKYITLGYRISFFLLFGFIIVFTLVFWFFKTNHNLEHQKRFKFNFLSENLIKTIMLISMLVLFFIPANINPTMIILWEEIEILNYIRAIVFIVGCSYLPGAILYNLLLKKQLITQKFKVEPFIVKITIYPLLSLAFLGISVLILDQFNLNKDSIYLGLLILIVGLYILDIILEKIKSNSINLKFIKIEISKCSFIIILLAIGVSTISIGFQLGWSYLISGDPWDSIKFASYIGDQNLSPIYIYSYPNFWGYIIFGLSGFTGLPFININTLLAPLSYLFVTSLYLFMKSLLHDINTKYSVLSVLLISLFSEFLIVPPISTIIFVGEFYFIYKSFSYFLFFIGISLFIRNLNQKQEREESFKKIPWNISFRSNFLVALLLVISFMTYMLPMFIALIFLFFYCFFSKDQYKSQNLKAFFRLVIITFLLFLIFDILMNFYLSYLILYQFLKFFEINLIRSVVEVIPMSLLIYLTFFIFILILIIINIKSSYRVRKIKISLRTFFKIIIIVYLLGFTFVSLEFLIFKGGLNEISFLILWLERFFLSFGLIGTIGISLSYYCFKNYKNLFKVIISWILISIIIASLLILFEWIKSYPSMPMEISERNLININYWFERIWSYSIIPLCVLASIGFFHLYKKIKDSYFFGARKPVINSFKYLFFLSIISFSFSGIVFTGILYGNANFRYRDDQIKTLSWISENIPLHSGVVVGDNFFMGVGTDSITIVRQYFFYDIFEADFNQTKCIEQIGFLKNETIQYAVISQFFILYFLNKSDFVNNILIPDFYNITLYNNGDLTVYYAPFFD